MFSTAIPLSGRPETAPLPTPLTAFETYMCADNLPDYPMAFVIRLQFSGRLDRRAFVAATSQAVARHPLLGARTEGRRIERLHWVSAGDMSPVIHFGGEGEPLRFPGGRAAIDLRIETGLRIWVREGTDRVDIRFQFHHACCDGIGAFRFFDDLLGAYHAEVEPAAAGELLRSLDPASLRHRATFGPTAWRRLRRLPIEFWGVAVGSLTFFLRRPVTVAAPRTPQVDAERRSQVLEMPSVTFDDAQGLELKLAAKQAGVTVNDWLLRDLFLAVERWNAEHDPTLARRVLRIMVPFNLREAKDDRMPAANIVGMVHIDRWMRLHADPRRLLRSLSWEMRSLKFFRFAVSHSRICACIRAIPGLMERIVARSTRCRASATLSNLGLLFVESRLPRREGKLVCGALTLDAVEAAPPVRRLSPIALAVLSYAGRLSLVMNYDRFHFEAEDANGLMQAIFAQIQTSLAETKPANAR